FKDGATTLGTGTLTAGGTATFSTSTALQADEGLEGGSVANNEPVADLRPEREAPERHRLLGNEDVELVEIVVLRLAEVDQRRARREPQRPVVPVAGQPARDQAAVGREAILEEPERVDAVARLAPGRARIEGDVLGQPHRHIGAHHPTLAVGAGAECA